MPRRFGEIKFNLMKAIELFQDMNDEDMDVYAPLSDYDGSKEIEVAERLNECLGQMIVDGLFNDCDYRDQGTDTDSMNTQSGSASEPSDRGYGEGSYGTNSRESFTNRFKRYIRRIMPGSRRSIPTDSELSGTSEEDPDVDGDDEYVYEGESSYSPSHSASLSYSLRDGGSERSSRSQRSRSPPSRRGSRASSQFRSRSNSGHSHSHAHSHSDGQMRAERSTSRSSRSRSRSSRR